MKYYAVKAGKKPGIYTTWDDCKAQVNGFSNAIYKSFPTLDEAKAFLGEENKEEVVQFDCVAYVDGSYDHSILAYGSGAVIFYDHERYEVLEMGNDKEMASMRNVAGEIIAATRAMQFALEHQCKTLKICYDYEGIEKWCTGVWQAKKDGTKAYKKFYDEAKETLTISFEKIKSHSNHALNDEADLLAKKALGIE